MIRRKKKITVLELFTISPEKIILIGCFIFQNYSRKGKTLPLSFSLVSLGYLVVADQICLNKKFFIQLHLINIENGKMISRIHKISLEIIHDVIGIETTGYGFAVLARVERDGQRYLLNDERFLFQYEVGSMKTSFGEIENV